MRWSLNIGRWFGIPVRLHFTFILLLGFLALANGLAGGSFGAAFDGVAFISAIFGCVLLHEFGHALMARRFGVGTKDITLLPIGGVVRLERIPDKPVQEFWIALAGPAINVGIVVLLGLWLALTSSLGSPASLSLTSGGFAERLLAVNIFLVLFNMLPSFPMDGGRVLRAFLAMRLDYLRATNIAGRLGQGMAVLFAIVGLFWNPFLLLIAFFVWFGASQEMVVAQTRSALSGITVGQAMVTDFRALSVEDRLEDVARLVLAGSQQDFPVVRSGIVEGLLERNHLVEGLNRLGAGASVGEAMCREFPKLEAGEAAETVLARNLQAKFPTLPVMSDGRLVGLFTVDNLSELLLLKSAMEKDAAPDASRGQWRRVVNRPAVSADVRPWGSLSNSR